MDIAFEHEIRQRAYEIWVMSGMNEGEAEAHWLHAERAVRTEAETAKISTAAATGKAKPAKAAAGAKKTVATKEAGTKLAKPKAAETKAAAAKPTATKPTAASRRPKAGPVEATA